MTLAFYLAFLVSQGRYELHNLEEVLREYAHIEAFAAFIEANGDYVVPQSVVTELRAGKKIAAIKIVRQELMDKGREYGLKIAKDIVEDYIKAHPESYVSSY